MNQQVSIENGQLVVPNHPLFLLLKVMVLAKRFGRLLKQFLIKLLKKLIKVSVVFNGKKYLLAKSHTT